MMIPTRPKVSLAGYEMPKMPALYLSIAAILVSNFITAVDSSLSSSAHLAIASHFDKTNISTWPVNAFLVCSITIQPLYASLSDCIGRRPIYLLSAFLFLVGTIAASLEPSWAGLILARCVCGFAAAGLLTMGSVVMTDLVGVKKRGHYQSLNYVNYGTGAALGSVSGGAIVEHLGWSYIYRLQLPLCVLSLMMVYLWIPQATDARIGEDGIRRGNMANLGQLLTQFDWLGSLLLVISLLCLVFILGTGGNVLPWTSPLIITAISLCPILIYLLVRVEARAKKPVFPALLLQFPFRNIMINAFLFSMINYVFTYNITLFFQSVKLESPSQASTHLFIPSLAFTLVSALTGTTIARLGTPRPTLRLSQGILLLGTVLCAITAATLPELGGTVWWYNICLSLPALGVGMMAPSALLTLLNLADGGNHAVANGGFIMMRSLGVFTATAISPMVVQNVFQGVVKGYGNSREKSEIEKARLNIDLLQSLDGDVQRIVVRAYQVGFIVLFSLLVILTLAIILGFARIPTGGQLAEFQESGDVQHRYAKVDEESGEGAEVEMAELLDDDD